MPKFFGKLKDRKEQKARAEAQEALAGAVGQRLAQKQPPATEEPKDAR